MQRVLVAGGAGLVGSHLVDRLLSDGNEVIAVDDLSRGSFANLAHLKRERRFVLEEHDLATPFRAEVDRIFHLALPSTRATCELDPVRAIVTCVLGTLHLLELAAANRARLVLGASLERWGEGVRCAESLAADFASSRGTDVRVVRLPSSYGPRMAPDGDHLVTSLVLQALRGRDLSTRLRLDRRVRLAYVGDVVETLMRAMHCEQRPPAAVAPFSEARVIDIAHIIANAAGLVGAEVLEAAAEGPPSLPMPMSWRAAVTDALPGSTALALAPPVALDEGLGRTVAWFEGRLGRRPETRSVGSAQNAGEAASTPAPITLRAG